jgi:hypothetical protein
MRPDCDPDTLFFAGTPANGGRRMRSFPRSMAEWERWCDCNPVAGRQLETLLDFFRAEVFRLRHFDQPTELSVASLRILAEQALGAAQRFWGAQGERAQEEIALIATELLEGVSTVQMRIGGAPSPPSPPVSLKGWVAVAWAIALPILENEQGPLMALPKKRRLAALSRLIEPQLYARGHPIKARTIEDGLRASVREWESRRDNPGDVGEIPPG